MHSFEYTINGLKEGNYTDLEPVFGTAGSSQCPIKTWVLEARFDSHPTELDEALTCAAWHDRRELVRFLLDRGLSPQGGNLTGMDAMHWTANRGLLATMSELMLAGASTESISRFGANVLGTAIWSALFEPQPAHLEVVRHLLENGAKFDHAQLEELGFPTEREDLNALLGEFMPKS